MKHLHLSYKKIGYVLAIFAAAFIWEGCSEEDAPQNLAPILHANPMEETNNEVTRSTAVVSGYIEGNWESASACYFMYSTTKSVLSSTTDENVDKVNVQPNADGSVEARLTGLTPGTTYYYCLAAQNGNTQVKSEIYDFKTKSTSAPVLGTLIVTEVGETEVSLQCQVLDEGGTEITQIGFQYKGANTVNYTTIPVEVYDNENDKTFSATIGNLQTATKYTFRAIAINRAEESSTSYSEEVSVTTNEKVSAEVVTGEYTAGANWIQINGIVNSPGGSSENPGTVTRYGVCWAIDKTPTAIPGQGDYKDAGTAATEFPVNFTTEITGLTPNTTYRVRAFAVSEIDGRTVYGYGETKEVTTSEFGTPVLKDIVISDITPVAAKFSSQITSTGNGTITERGFCYSKTNQNPSVTDTSIAAEGEDLVFSATAENLEPNTTYYVRAYAKSRISDTNEKIGYSNVESFSTINYNDINITLKIISTTYNAAEVSAIVEDDGTIIERGFCWNTTGEPTTQNNKVVVEANKDFEANITGLVSNTTYYCRAYAVCQRNGKNETFYSYTESFYTKEIQSPTFNNLNATDITRNSAKLSAAITDTGDGTIVEKGFCWGITDNPTTADKKQAVEGNELVANISGLKSQTKYSYRAYAIYEVDGKQYTGYSYAYSFTTKSIQAPTIAYIQVEAALRSAHLSTSITDSGEGTVVEFGFCWSTSQWNPTLENGKYDGSIKIEAGKPFEYEMTGLTPGKQYYVSAYAKAEVDGETVIGYSSTSFYTQSLEKASVNTPSSSNVAEDSFTVSSKLIGTGNTDVTEIGFCWTTDADAKPETLINKQVVTLNADNTFSHTLTGLTGKTTYYVYAYAVNEAGTAYSGQCTVTTKYAPGKDDQISPDKP